MNSKIFCNKGANNIIKSLDSQRKRPKVKEFLEIRRAISLNMTFVFFVEITTGDTRHTQQIQIDEPSMYPCPLVRIFKTGFPKCMSYIYFVLNENLF